MRDLFRATGQSEPSRRVEQMGLGGCGCAGGGRAVRLNRDQRNAEGKLESEDGQIVAPKSAIVMVRFNSERVVTLIITITFE